MHLGRLKVDRFRNLGVQELVFPPEGVAIVGENAQGKTNLLEAIYYLETFRSFRGAPDERLVPFGEDVFRVAGTVEEARPSGDAIRVAAAFDRRTRRKKVTTDGSEPARVGDALGTVAAVVFSPADLEIVGGGPAERRRFLDILLSLNLPGYLETLQRFRHALAQRNAALRDQAPAALVRAFDDALVRCGSRVLEARRDWIARWGSAFSEAYAAVSGGPRARMEYVPGVPLEGAEGGEDVEAAYRSALVSSAERERRAGATVMGPHRDEMVLRLEEGDLEVRAFGSGGQRRTAALALRLVEAATIRQARGREPLVLMDDVFAELDEHRSERVLALIDRPETGQVILTAPKESDVKLRREVLSRWSIRGGVVAS